jgi:drug/metabolite transporter (DMT)-like permease
MPTLKKIPIAAFSILLLGGVAIGTTGIFMRYSDVNPFASAFWRMALAVPILWIGALMVKKRDEGRGRHTNFGKVLTYVGLYFAGDMGVLHLSLHYTTVANATTLANFAPVLIALFMWRFHHVRFARIYVIGMVMALVGAVVLVGPSVSMGGTKLLGDMLGLVAAIFYAGYQLMVKAARIHYSPWRLMAASTTITAVALLPFALAMPGPFWPESLFHWWPLMALALVAQIGGQSAIAYASAHLPASLSSVSLLIQPLSATVGAMFLFHEWLTPVQAIGGGLLLFGIFMSTRGHRGH